MENTNSDLGPKLTALADGLLDDLLNAAEKPSVEQRIDALKAIGQLYLGLRKLKRDVSLDEDSEGSMSAMRKRINEAGAYQQRNEAGK